MSQSPAWAPLVHSTHVWLLCFTVLEKLKGGGAVKLSGARDAVAVGSFWSTWVHQARETLDGQFSAACPPS